MIILCIYIYKRNLQIHCIDHEVPSQIPVAFKIKYIGGNLKLEGSIMGRTIVTRHDVRKPMIVKASITEKEPTEDTFDTYKDRLLKYVPAEVVTLYVFLQAAVEQANTPDMLTLLWIIFGVMMVGTWVHLWRVEKVQNKVQLSISTIAFAVWVFALGGPFSHMEWYEPIYGGILLPVYTFFVAMIVPPHEIDE